MRKKKYKNENRFPHFWSVISCLPYSFSTAAMDNNYVMCDQSRATDNKRMESNWFRLKGQDKLTMSQQFMSKETLRYNWSCKVQKGTEFHGNVLLAHASVCTSYYGPKSLILSLSLRLPPHMHRVGHAEDGDQFWQQMFAKFSFRHLFGD